MTPALQSRRARRLLVRAPLAALLALGACKKAPEDAHDDGPRSVLVTDAVRTTTQVFGPFTGSVEARYQSKLGFRTSGRTSRRDVDVGDLVHKDEELAALDDTLLRLALQKAGADIMNAQAGVDNDEATLARKRYLLSKGDAPQSQLDTAAADQRTASAKLDQDKAALTTARDNLTYAELHADFDGVVTEWNAEVGQQVLVGNSVVTLARFDVREAVVDVPDDLIGEVHEHEAFTVALLASEAVTAEGVVREIAPSAESATRSRRVRFTLQHPSDAFRLGSTITVFVLKPIAPFVAVPATALFEHDGKTAVWVVPAADDKLRRRDVTVDRRSGDEADVTAGLVGGDRVVAAGVQSIRDGQPVRVITSFPAPPSAEY